MPQIPAHPASCCIKGGKGAEIMNRNEPMYYSVVQGLCEKRHFHTEMEVMYVVLGSVKVRIMDAEYELEKNDVLLVNSGVEHSVDSSGDAVLCTVVYTERLFDELFGDQEEIFFLCNSADRTGVDEPGGMGHSYEKIRGIFQEILLAYIRPEGENKCEERSLLYKLLACLTEKYRLSEESGQSGADAGENERLQQILRYVNQNFTGSISLAELAAKMYTSSSTLSRFFKKQTGIYFADYVSQVRMRYAMQGLMYSDDSITKIAVDSGFSNLSVFNRLFREMYGMPPTEYRKKHRPEQFRREELRGELVEKLREELAEPEKEERIMHVKVDALESHPYQKVWNRVVNVGSANTLLMANTQYHVVYLAENLGFQYVRIWNIFSKQMMVTDGVHVGNYSYAQIDIVFDFLDQHGLIPFIDFGIRPWTAVKDADDFVFFGEECIAFQSREAWEAMVSDFIRHIVKRYGEEKAQKWIFEMAYDVRHNAQCYQAEDYSFFDTYQFLYRTVKDQIPKAEVGGPMAIPHFSDGLIRDFLKRCREQQCFPDFLSILLFPYITEEKDGEISYHRTADPSFEVAELRRIRSLMKEMDAETKLYVSEWNNTLSSRNYLNDSCFRASYFVRKLTEMWGLADMTAVWMASDWVSNYFDVGGVANGGNGLLTKDTICKPAYYALQFMNTLGECLVAKGENYLITRKEQKDYYILCFNYRPLKGDYYLDDRRMDDPRGIRRIYEGEEPVEIEIDLQSMRADRYVVRCRTVSPRDGSLLWEWKKFDFDNSLTSQEVRYIRQICFPRIHMKKQDTENGVLKIREKIGVHELVLIHIYEE